MTRCGVFCALLSSIEHCKTDSVVDVFQIVKGLRIQKPGIVQTVVRKSTAQQAGGGWVGLGGGDCFIKFPLPFGKHCHDLIT